jgi:phosphohistidine phosphatase
LKTLYLIRHAKSTWNIPGIADIDRPLNERGYTDAHEMATRIKKKILPANREGKIIVSSPATRAISTALIFARHLNYDASGILIHPLLYDTNTNQYSSVIESLPDEHDQAIVVGHNPVITELANLLGGASVDEMSTCGIVGIEFDRKTWSEAVEFGGKMSFYDFPKNEG